MTGTTLGGESWSNRIVKREYNIMNVTASGWARVDDEVALVTTARASEYTSAITSNLADLLDLLRSTNRPPPTISPGYWPTFCLEWDFAEAENLLIEVFDNRYEVYRFFDGRTDIWHEQHAASQTPSAAFLDELPRPMSP